jgi:hypothetical protein
MMALILYTMGRHVGGERSAGTVQPAHYRSPQTMGWHAKYRNTLDRPGATM